MRWFWLGFMVLLFLSFKATGAAAPWLTLEQADARYPKLIGDNTFDGLNTFLGQNYGDAIILKPKPGTETTNPQRKAHIIWQADDGQCTGIIVAHKDADSNHFSIYTAGPTPRGCDVIKAFDAGGIGLNQTIVLYGNVRLIMPDGSTWKITEGDTLGILRLWRVQDWRIMEEWPNP